VSGGVYRVSPTKLGGDAAAMFDVDEWLPIYFEPKASVVAGKPTGGYRSNADRVFDYQSRTDFKFAGVGVSLNRMLMSPGCCRPGSRNRVGHRSRCAGGGRGDSGLLR